MAKRYRVQLSINDRRRLQEVVDTATAAAGTITRANVLLKVDSRPQGPEWSDAKVAQMFDVHRITVQRIRKRAVTEGVEAALQEGRRGRTPPKLTRDAELRLHRLARSLPPADRKRWTLQLLARQVSDQEGIPISYELVRRILKKSGMRIA